MIILTLKLIKPKKIEVIKIMFLVLKRLNKVLRIYLYDVNDLRLMTLGKQSSLSHVTSELPGYLLYL